MSDSKVVFHSASTSDLSTRGIEATNAKLRLFSTVNGIRTGLTLLALCAGLAILGVSADALAVYETTHVPPEYLLPLWPDDLDLRPTVTFVVSSAIIILANGASIVADKLPFIRNTRIIRTPVMVLAPLAAFVAALTAMAVFYGVNTSDRADTVQSWSCRWEDVFMTAGPHFGTLCKQSRAGLYLSVLLVPLELVAFAAAGYQLLLERNASEPVMIGFAPRLERQGEKEGQAHGSPVPSSVRTLA